MTELELNLRCAGEDQFELQLQKRLPLRRVTGIYGPSGSGKTTLLHCIAGLRQGSEGSFIRFGKETWQAPGLWCPPWERSLGYVFQDARLFPHLNVAGNLSFGRQRQRREGLPRDAVIAWFDLAELLHRMPTSLSAGQRQRVAMARALLASPRLLLLDEPLANLDRTARIQCIKGLAQARQECGVPMLYVSHDMEELSKLADQLLLLQNGREEAFGPLIELCGRIDNRLAREQHAAAVVEAELAGHDPEFGLSALRVAGQTLWVNQIPGKAGQRRRLRIPARDVSLCRSPARDSSILNVLRVSVSDIENTSANRMLLQLKLGDQHILARITRRSVVNLRLQRGETLFAQIKTVALLSEELE